jgi:hypothetical protein
MSVPAENAQQSFFDVSALMSQLFAKPGNRYRIFREKVLPALRAKRPELLELYCETNGRPAIEPVVALGATLLQFMERVPDRKAEESVRLHLGWKYALDLEVDDPGFDHSALGRFRARLLEGGAERIGFDALLGGLKEAGMLKGTRKQRLDSTHVLGAVAKMSRLEVVRETIRLVMNALQPHREGSGFGDGAVFEERYLDSEIAWHRLSRQGLKEKFAQAGEDAWALLQWIRRQPESVREHPKSFLLERVFEEQYEFAEGAPTRRKEEASGVVKNPHDPDVQWAAKDQKKTKTWEGYKVQVAETVAEDGQPQAPGEPTEEFITEVTTTEAIASDLDGHRRVEEQQAAHGVEPAEELYVDAAYVTDDTLAKAHTRGRELLGPARPAGNSSGKDLFTAEDFDVDIAHRTAICPAGHASRQCSRLENQETGQVNYRFEWAGLCDSCELKSSCTRSRSGRRMLLVGEHHDLLQQRRREMQTDSFAHRMWQRNGIEGTLSEFVRSGARRSRYRSLCKTTLANYFHGAAVNANRWIRRVQWELLQQEKAA